MNKRINKIVSLSMVALLSLSTVSYANNVEKDETVYVNLFSNGEAREIIVSDWIHSNEPGVKVVDQSILDGIKNVKGDEEPVIEGDNISWTLEENDLFYQGTTDKKLPLDIHVKYYLDDTEISPEQLVGKTGKVRLELEIINLEKHKVLINDEEREIYTAFSTVSIINLPMDNFSNVEVNTGKVVNDGNNQVITYLAIPGLNEFFAEDSEYVDLPDKLVVEADVKEFEMGPIMITATSKLPEIKELDNINSMSELVDSIGQLESASSRLSSATGSLAAGQSEFATNFEKFQLGVQGLGQGNIALINGVTKLGSGIDGAYAGANKVANGIKMFASSTVQFGEGSTLFGLGANEFAKKAQEFSSGASKVAAGTTQIIENTNKLEVGAKQLALGSEELINGQEQLSMGISSSLAGIRALIENKEKVSPEDPFLASLKQLEQGLVALEQGSKNMSNELGNLKKGQDSLAKGLGELSAGSKGLQPAASLLQEGSKGLSGGATKLAESAIVLESGSKQMTEGVNELVIGSQAVSDGLGELSFGAKELSAGKDELEQGNDAILLATNELIVGANKLNEGSKELDVNMNKFHNEGITRLSDGVEDKIDLLNDLAVLKDELIKLSNEYNNFAGIDSNMEGTIKFVMKTDEIKSPEIEEISSVKVEETEKGFINWVKGLFK